VAQSLRAFIYVPELGQFSYGDAHPFRLGRLTMTHDLIEAYGLLNREGVSVIEPEPAREEDILRWHSPDFVAALRRADAGESIPGDEAYGLGTGDNPVFPGLWRYCLLYTGATLAAVKAVTDGGAGAAFNMAGGLHHAHAGRASGFCYVNDIVLGILELLDRFDRVLYVDIDAHHGDGVEEAFWRSDRVLTLSLHESGRYLFPGTGFETEIGEGAGRGFSVNVPFQPGVTDGIYLRCFQEVAVAILEHFRPQAVVAQLGVDGLARDPLAHLGLGNGVHAKVTEFLASQGLPLVALGGGGYDLDNVARGWTVVWDALLSAGTSDDIPEAYLRRYGGRRALRDRPFDDRDAPAETRKDALRVREHLLKEVVPLIHDRGRR
jgi:acetoin utilization protein AcuC